MVGESAAPCYCPYSILSELFILAILVGVWSNLFVVATCIALLANDVKNVFTCLLDICKFCVVSDVTFCLYCFFSVPFLFTLLIMFLIYKYFKF